MEKLTRREFVAAAAGGFGALAHSHVHAAPPDPCAGNSPAKVGQPAASTAATVRAAAASVKLTDDNMAQLHGRTKVFNQGWEGEFRANALVIEAEQPICLVSVDSTEMRLDVSRPAARRIAAATGIPEQNILFCATHSHRAPGTSDVFGKPDREFVHRMEEGSVLAVLKAVAAIRDAKSDAQATIFFGQSQEATVGRNSRLLLKDGAIGWYGYEESDVVRPTGPYDPDLYVLALRRPNGKYAGLAFNHSSHNIGHLCKEGMSPCFFGLAALEIERRHGATTLFLPGAIGSTHNITYNNSGVPAGECVHRMVDAIEEALGRLQPALPGPVRAMTRPFTYRVRRFDEAKEAAAVKAYADRYLPREAAGMCRTFGRLRQELAPHQGKSWQTSLQIIRLGDLALVGIPGELFARLGLELRRRSPFRHTCIIGVANEYLGYIPDRKAYADGGYQTWVAGWHGMFEIGTGEAMVDQAVAMLNELYDAAPPRRRGA